MKKLLLLSAVALLCVACKDSAQQSDSFVITGQVCLPDGYTAGLVVDTDTAMSVSVCKDVVIKDGKFVMTGKADRPYPGTLMTNNLALIEQNHWPVDSVRWTYSEVFVSNGELQFVLDDLSGDEPKGRLTGTQVQADFNDLLDKGGKRDADPWAFIDSHPQSAVSVWLACQLTDRAYNLTAAQVAHLQQTITQCPDDTARFNRLQQKLEAAKVTVKDAPLVSLELVDTEGNTYERLGSFTAYNHRRHSPRRPLCAHRLLGLLVRHLPLLHARGSADSSRLQGPFLRRGREHRHRCRRMAQGHGEASGALATVLHHRTGLSRPLHQVSGGPRRALLPACFARGQGALLARTARRSAQLPVITQ